MGAAVASLVPAHPVWGFTLGFASHLVLDAIPHRDYHLLSVAFDAEKKPTAFNALHERLDLLRDVSLVAGDALAGLGLAFIFFVNFDYPWAFLFGALGSLLPDFLTFLYIIFKHKTLAAFLRLHSGLFHSKISLGLDDAAGVLLQFLTVAILIMALFGLRRLLF